MKRIDSGRLQFVDASSANTAIARVHAQAPLDAILLTGDNFYPCGVKSVDDPRWSLVRPLTRVGVPIFPVLGNHDYCGKAVPESQILATGAVPYWRFPAPQYALRTPMADFAFINTTPFVRGHDTPVASMIRCVARWVSRIQASITHPV